MAKKEKKKEESKKDVIETEGIVTEVLPGMKYKVQIEFQGIQHELEAYVAGKMKSNFINIYKGDQVKLEISMYDIDTGRITYRLTQRTKEPGPPRRPRK